MIEVKEDFPKATATQESLVQAGTKYGFQPGATKKQTVFSEYSGPNLKFPKALL
jgi:hypothetical protein